jgi:hypothetical protein
MEALPNILLGIVVIWNIVRIAILEKKVSDLKK